MKLKPYRELISPLGPAEAEVMAVLWEAQRPLSVKDVRLAVRTDEYNPVHTTVMTVCSRLAEKVVLRREKDPESHCNAYLYKAAISRAELLAQAVEQLLASVGADEAEREHVAAAIGSRRARVEA